MTGSRRAKLLGAALLAGALVLSVLAAMNDRLLGDLWLARRIQDLPGWFEFPAEATRFLTNTWVVVIAGTVLVTVLDFTARRRAWLGYLLLLLLLPLMQATIKNLVDRPRPDSMLIERRASFTSESFPAGHVMSGTAVFILAAALIAGRLPEGRPRAITWLIAIAACLLNGVANVYEGVHWPSDVLGGYLWASVFLWVAWWATRRRRSA